jgi:ribosomal protein L6P/L9E
MLWYAAFLQKNSTLTRRLQDNKLNNKKKTYNFRNKYKRKTSNYINTYLLPKSWNFIIFLKKHTNLNIIVMFSRKYYITLPLNIKNSSFTFDKITNQIIVSHNFINNFNTLYNKIIYTSISILYKPYFNKLKFKGKGYYIYKNHRNTVTPQFGYSHRLYMYAYFLHVRFLSKTSLIIFGLNLKSVNKTSKQIFNWRPLNIFTGRGVRFSKQIVYRKSGKVSSYK